MKAVVVITDSEVMKQFERACISNRERGFTIIPKVWGQGKTGVKAGSRVYPSGLSLLFTVVPDAELDATMDLLKKVRDDAGATDVTKMFVVPAEEVA